MQDLRNGRLLSEEQHAALLKADAILSPVIILVLSYQRYSCPISKPGPMLALSSLTPWRALFPLGALDFLPSKHTSSTVST